MQQPSHWFRYWPDMLLDIQQRPVPVGLQEFESSTCLLFMYSKHLILQLRSEFVGPRKTVVAIDDRCELLLVMVTMLTTGARYSW